MKEEIKKNKLHGKWIQNYNNRVFARTAAIAWLANRYKCGFGGFMDLEKRMVSVTILVVIIMVIATVISIISKLLGN